MPSPRLFKSLALMSLVAALAGSTMPGKAAQTKRGDLPLRPLPMNTFRDRLRGGWAGQMVGVSYGSVYEFRSLNQPITTPLRDWQPEFVENSIHQDDIYVEMTFLKTLEQYGPKATSHQAGLDFRDSRYSLWHANMAARENLKQGIMPPMSGHPRYNPHADDIDFQIEADLFGLISPGMPRAAAKMSDVFGSIMNYGDGLYGGRFVTGMYAQAYLEPEPTPAAIERCIRAGLASIPAKSAYAQTIRDTLDGHKKYPNDWLKTWHLLQDKWGNVDLCPEGYKRPFNIDAKLNGAYIALGLLYGEGDFAKTLEITTRCGQDADCNPSSAAGILGTIYGYKRIPATYTSGIAALTGQKFDYTDYDYPHLITACERMVLKVLKENGGSVRNRADQDILLLPVQTPAPPKKLEQMKSFGVEQVRKWAADFDARLAKAHTTAIPVEKWSRGWKLVANGTDMQTGIFTFLGRTPVLVTHPVSETVPAAIEKKVTVPKRTPRLLLSVSSYPDVVASDWELRIKIDGKTIDEQVIHAPGRWLEMEVDLTSYAGKTVMLRLENAAGGSQNWSYEAGYWAYANISGEKS